MNPLLALAERVEKTDNPRVRPAIGSHNVYLDVGRTFIVFNDDPDLPFLPISQEDLIAVKITPGSSFASAAWSADVHWYFILLEDGIVLLNTFSDKGFFCRKRSAEFIRMFLEPEAALRARAGRVER